MNKKLVVAAALVLGGAFTDTDATRPPAAGLTHVLPSVPTSVTTPADRPLSVWEGGFGERGELVREMETHVWWGSG